LHAKVDATSARDVEVEPVADLAIKYVTDAGDAKLHLVVQP
jgi:hypothetical protein